MEHNRIVVSRGANDDWYWHFQAKNGRLMAVGGEGYRNLEDIRTALLMVCDIQLPTEWIETRTPWLRELSRYTAVEVIIRD